MPWWVGAAAGAINHLVATRHKHPGLVDRAGGLRRGMGPRAPSAQFADGLGHLSFGKPAHSHALVGVYTDYLIWPIIRTSVLRTTKRATGKRLRRGREAKLVG